MRTKKFIGQHLTLTAVMAITGRLCVSVTEDLWRAGGGAKVPDLVVGVVCRGRDGLRRRRRRKRRALLRLLLLTSFLPEEKTWSA